MIIESAAPRSRVKHSTTEALRSQAISVICETFEVYVNSVFSSGLSCTTLMPCYKLQIILQKWHAVTHLFREPCRHTWRTCTHFGHINSQWQARNWLIIRYLAKVAQLSHNALQCIRDNSKWKKKHTPIYMVACLCLFVISFFRLFAWRYGAAPWRNNAKRKDEITKKTPSEITKRRNNAR